MASAPVQAPRRVDLCGRSHRSPRSRAADEAAPTGDCDEEQATQILGLDCPAIHLSMLDNKADTFVQQRADFACALGFYAMCTVPLCQPGNDEPDTRETLPPVNPALNDPEAQEPSACAQEALAYQGCGACRYYTCLEETMRCGPDGYLLRFANAYCLRYRLVSEPLASPDAAAWLTRVRRCLIKELDQALPVEDCDALERAGLESHPRCYISTGFCDLAAADWWLVLGTIKASDWSFREMLLAGHGCLAKWLGNVD